MNEWTPTKIVVFGLLSVLFTTVGGMVAGMMLGKDMPSELSAIAMPIITALAAFVSPAPSKVSTPAPTATPAA
jgi:hypothetical protein